MELFTHLQQTTNCGQNPRQAGKIWFASRPSDWNTGFQRGKWKGSSVTGSEQTDNRNRDFRGESQESNKTRPKTCTVPTSAPFRYGAARYGPARFHRRPPPICQASSSSRIAKILGWRSSTRQEFPAGQVPTLPKGIAPASLCLQEHGHALHAVNLQNGQCSRCKLFD